MARDDKDRSGKWLLKHHGDSILHLANFSGVQSWTSSQSDLTIPRQMPDGYFQVTFEGSSEPSPVLIELATYPERRVTEQTLADLMIVYLNDGALPDVVTLVLRPKGQLAVTGEEELQSAREATQVAFSWRVVNLWEVDAEDLLSTGEVGLVPWVPLSRFDDEPESMLQRCRDRIEEANTPQRINFLAVCQVMTRLRYNDPDLMNIFGGRDVMIESPLIRELMDEGVRQTRCEDILAILTSRFGAVPKDLQAALEGVSALDDLATLRDTSLSCQSLEEFEAALPKE